MRNGRTERDRELVLAGQTRINADIRSDGRMVGTANPKRKADTDGNPESLTLTDSDVGGPAGVRRGIRRIRPNGGKGRKGVGAAQ